MLIWPPIFAAGNWPLSKMSISKPVLFNRRNFAQSSFTFMDLSVTLGQNTLNGEEECCGKPFIAVGAEP